MEYFDENMNDFSNSNDIQIWNSSSVYFDDEVVEYQGKYYRALRKTSTDIPGRCKAGIWKELAFHEDEEKDYDYSYAGEEVSDQRTLNENKDAAPAPSAKSEPPVIPLEKNSAKPVNKPLVQKQTLSERQNDKKQIIQTNATIPKEDAMSQNEMRRMTVAPTDQHIVNELLKQIDFKKIKGDNVDEQNITDDLILPQKAKEGLQLAWESSHPELISSQGKVSRPLDGQDAAVNLSVKVTKNISSSTRFFTLWVKAQEKVYTDEECVDIVYELLDFNQIRGDNTNIAAITHNLELFTHGLHNTEIFWASNYRDIMDETGLFYQKRLTGNTQIRLYAIIVKGNVERLKHFDLILKMQ